MASLRPKHGQPQPVPVSPAGAGEAVPSKRDLTSWWKGFKKSSSNKEREEEKEAEQPGIFGVPLQTSIRYANVAISLYDDQGRSYIYGYVPIVVAKCGVFLKEKATDIEGIFRLAGSEKRIKELRTAFNSPDRYGKGLDWTGYTVHDAANILRRYFNQLPEPIIPLEFYDQFRDPLKGHQSQAVGQMEGQTPATGDFDMNKAIREYQHLITELPPLNRQLLLYILDLLAVFASKSDQNKMTTPNLAAIFQPGLLSHPQHDMAPSEYRLSQDVLIFLIENQDNFLIGMQGTAVDAKTVEEVQSGPPTPSGKPPGTPGRKQGLGRSTSNASAGAESVRKFGDIRRNVSVSSRRSKHSTAAPSPVTPAFTNTGVHRSNTVPSRRSPHIQPTTRFSKENKPSDPPTPTSGLTPPTTLSPNSAATTSNRPSPEVESSTSSDTPTLKPQPPDAGAQTQASQQAALQVSPQTQQAYQLSRTQATSPQPIPQGTTPTRKLEPADYPNLNIDPNPSPSGGPPRTFTSIFGKSPSTSDTEKNQKDPRRPRKLQKKRGPGNANESANSSTQSLSGAGSSYDGPPSPLPPSGGHSSGHFKETPELAQTAIPESSLTPQKATGSTLQSGASPTSSSKGQSDVFTDQSENEQGENTRSAPEERERRHRWRLSSSKKDQEHTPKASTSNFGANSKAEQSMSSFGSQQDPAGRKSFTLESQPYGQSAQNNNNYNAATPSYTNASEATMISGSSTTPGAAQPDNKEPEKKLGWFGRKMQERREKAEEKQRAKSPPSGSRASLMLSSDALPMRGKSMDVPRGVSMGDEGRKE